MYNPNEQAYASSSSQRQLYNGQPPPSSQQRQQHFPQPSPPFLHLSTASSLPPTGSSLQENGVVDGDASAGASEVSVQSKGKMKVKDEPGVKLKRKRGRLATACKACNSRKQRCDGGCPCLNCTKRGVGDSCVFPDSVLDPSLNGEPSRSRPKPTPPSSETRLRQPTSSSSSAPYLQPPPPLASPSAPSHSVSRPPPLFRPSSEPQQQRQQLPPPPPQPLRRAQQPQQPVQPLAGPSTITRIFPSTSKEPPAESPAYFGGSYFGPAAALRIIAGALTVDEAGSLAAPVPAHRLFRLEMSESTQVSQIREFIKLLPKRTTCDRLVAVFFEMYDSHLDLVYRPEFQAKYEVFWQRSFDADDISRIDMRWLALLFVIMAFGCLLEWTEYEGMEGIRNRDEASDMWYWAARRAIMGSPTFHGESLDIVRATILVTFYLVNQRRAPEAWLLISYAARFAQAQGLHIDGGKWNLSLREAEIRRRLWAQLYCLDRSISLFLGRPLSIQNEQSIVKAPANIHDEELDSPPSPPRPLSEPTRSTFLILHKSLSSIIGSMQNLCFGVQTTTFGHVLHSDAAMVSWSQDLPPHFTFDDPDTSLDAQFPWITYQRMSLHSKFHLSRLSLHRPFLLRAIVDEEYRASREACIASAFGDMSLRLKVSDAHPITRFHWMTVSGGFNAASILGIVLIRDPWGPLSERIIKEIREYISIQRATIRKEQFLDAEVRIIEMCLAKAEQARSDILERQERLGVVVRQQGEAEYYSDEYGSSGEESDGQDDGVYDPSERGGPPSDTKGLVQANVPPPDAYSFSPASFPPAPSFPSQLQQNFAPPPPLLPHQTLTPSTTTISSSATPFPDPDKPSPTLAAFPPLDAQSSWQHQQQPLASTSSSSFAVGDAYEGVGISENAGGPGGGDLFSMAFPEDPNDWENWEDLIDRLTGGAQASSQGGGAAGVGGAPGAGAF